MSLIEQLTKPWENSKMGQAEIQEILRENKGKWISTIELKIKLNQTSSVITRALNKMFQYGEVKKKKSPVTEDTQRCVFFWRVE